MICHLCLPRDVTDSVPAVYAKWQLQKLFAPSAVAAPSTLVVPGPATFAETPVPAVVFLGTFAIATCSGPSMACRRYGN